MIKDQVVLAGKDALYTQTPVKYHHIQLHNGITMVYCVLLTAKSEDWHVHVHLELHYSPIEIHGQRKPLIIQAHCRLGTAGMATLHSQSMD